MARLELKNVSRAYPGGEELLLALDGIDLTIESGESIAIVGASGSGKSTLMNILGCLDRPTSGTYLIESQDTAALNPDALADMRREYFGFIFQRYNLLPDLSALGNVEVPAIYARLPRASRHVRARALLERLGLQTRHKHRPTQLSGGQQQRVSIARALMNGGRIILADEPTGALDSHSGEDVLRFLQDLNSQGHTLILVTHDTRVAAHAQRTVELQDGKIIADQRRGGAHAINHSARTAQFVAAKPSPLDSVRSVGDDLLESMRMALLAMRARRLRTALTMLGIIVGIASLVLVVALGTGAEAEVIDRMRALGGTNTVDIMAGRNLGDAPTRAATLNARDVAAIMSQGYVDSVTPLVITDQSVRAGNISVSVQVAGVGEQFFRVHGMELIEGSGFTALDTRTLAQVAVLDDKTEKRLFAEGSALGKIILVGNMPCRIIGVSTLRRGEDPSLYVYQPYTTTLGRLLGSSALTMITARISDHAPTELAQSAIEKLLKQRHGRKDFNLFNIDAERKQIEGGVQSLSLLISAIALISLLVGGIGVMNIMLISVTERTREIGVRTAVGARRADILRQFLIEAVLVCLLGGALGILVALIGGWIFNALTQRFPLIFSPTSMLTAFAASTLIGIVFGFLPARSAANLDPIEALARE